MNSSELPGISTFSRVGDDVFHTYFTFGRGIEVLHNDCHYLDLTALGCQEAWEQPKGSDTPLGLQVGDRAPSELKGLTGRAVIEIRVAHATDIAAATALLAPLGSEPPQVDEPTRRVSVPVIDGAARLADALRVVAVHNIAVDDLARSERRRARLRVRLRPTTGASPTAFTRHFVFDGGCRGSASAKRNAMRCAASPHREPPRPIRRCAGETNQQGVRLWFSHWAVGFSR
jgi:hypothetical protein